MPVIRVAIAGLGAIGRVLARRLADGIPGLVLAAAAARDVAKAQAWLDAERITCPLVEPEAFPALLGLDAVTAAAEGQICSVRMITRKPPRGLAGAPYLEANGISIEGLNEPKRVFAGSARDGAAGFPANVNVAAALSLAGIGPDRTMMEIWADPTVERNCHTIEIDSDSARFTLSIENIPSENPKTGRITALSVLAALRKLQAPLRVGT